MPPPTEPFNVEELERRVDINPNGRLKKYHTELRKCRLKEMDQYNCWMDIKDDSPTKGEITCESVTRFFRQCSNGMTVETTAWEGLASQGKK